jgi:hypothetical protein
MTCQSSYSAAIKDALRLRAVGFDAVKHLLLCRIEKRPPKPDLASYPYLPRAICRARSAARDLPRAICRARSAARDLPRANVEATSAASHMTLITAVAE